MNKLHHTYTTHEGWAIHVYSRDRRLLYSLEPSHGWVFAAGIALGLFLAGIGVNRLASYSPSATPQASSDFTAPLQID